MDWSWATGLQFECIPGVASMRLLTYAYGDITEFMYDHVLEFLDKLNCNTGILDLLQSSWAALMVNGWPVFFQLLFEVQKQLDKQLWVDPIPRGEPRLARQAHLASKANGQMAGTGPRKRVR